MDEPQLTEEGKVILRKKQTELVKIIEALAGLSQTADWNIIREMIFDKSSSSIERQLLNESINPVVNINKIYKLQGELEWSRRFGNIDRYIESLKNQLQEIKKKLK